MEDGECTYGCIGVNGVDHDDQVLVVEVWCKIQTWCSKIEDFDEGGAFVLTAKGFDSKRAKAIVTKEDVTQADYRYEAH